MPVMQPILNVLMDFDCILQCDADDACREAFIRCGDDSNCYIQGNGDHSLYNMTIIGPESIEDSASSLSVECNGAHSCHSATALGIRGNALDIICGETQSCSDLSMTCPQHPSSCKITATTQESMDDVIHILAVNSWKDLNKSSYLPLGTRISMHCGSTGFESHCDLPLNNNNNNNNNMQLLDASNWNCRNKASQCYVDQAPVHIIRCDADTPCLHTNISCDRANDTDAGCRVICDGNGSCSDSHISCLAEDAFCDVVCNGDNSCSEIHQIDCGVSSQCNIDCLGQKSCSNMDVHCTHSADGNCNINAFDAESLVGSRINCASSNCSVYCESGGSCQEMAIHGATANLLAIECVNASCSNLELHCPASVILDDLQSRQQRCILSGGEGDIHSELAIYAENSWHDIDVSDYDAIVVEYEEDENYTNASSISRMFCGSDFSDSCVITKEWNCLHTTSSCYVGDSPIICEHEACIGQELSCSDRVVVDECNLQCKTSGACSDVVFNCRDDKSCRVECESADSCSGAVINCGNNANCFVSGNAENALYGARIVGGSATDFECALNVACNASSACLEARIFGQDVDELNIDCLATDACKDVAIHCPAHGVDELTGDLIKRCIVAAGGHENQKSETTHSNLTIRAVHSWNDIEFDNYLPIISDSDSKMYCGESDTISGCYINNPSVDHEWNCISAESACYVDSHSERNITEAPSLTEIICDDGEYSCKDQTNLQCSNKLGCKFICSSNQSCFRKNLHCGDSEKCLVHCIGEQACAQSVVYSDSRTNIDITCEGESSCSSARFDAVDASDLSVHCIGSHGCQNVNVSCPPHQKILSDDEYQPMCLLDGGNEDFHDELTFYAIHGFEDLDVSQYKAGLLNLGTEENTNRMYWGDEYQYQCDIHCVSETDPTLFCDCGFEYEYDSSELEQDDDNNGLSKKALVAIILPICIVFVLALVILIICIFYCSRKRHGSERPGGKDSVQYTLAK